MASFYGNIKNNSRASFIFDKIYSSRTEMEAALQQTDKKQEDLVIGDGIFTHRYVLIDYGFVRADPDVPGSLDEWVDRYEIQTDANGQQTGTRIENPIYAEHRKADADNFHAEYDQTAWMKIYTNDVEKYIMVARLKAEAPAFEIVPCAPGEHGGVPHFDLKNSTDINYKYHVPANWNWTINNYNPALEKTKYTESTPEYSLYEISTTASYRTYHTGHEYPYFNKDGFDTKIWSRTDGDESQDTIKAVEASSGKKYYTHTFSYIELTPDTYIPDRYYVAESFEKDSSDPYDSSKEYYEQVTVNSGSDSSEAQVTYDHIYFYKPDTFYVVSSDGTAPKLASAEFDANAIYSIKKGQDYIVVPVRTYEKNKYYYPTSYKLATEDYNAKAAYFLDTISNEEIVANDTKRLDIHIPSIGNMVSDGYDMMYGKPYNQRGLFTSSDNEKTYEGTPGDKTGRIYVKTYVETTEGTQINSYYLTQEQYNELHREKTETFNIPVSIIGLYAPVLGEGENYPYTESSSSEAYIKCKIGEKIYYLTPEQYRELSHYYNSPEGYTVLVEPQEFYRPYEEKELYEWMDVDPYNNIHLDDPISVAWALDNLKRYISELRYLANGSGIVGYTNEDIINGSGNKNYHQLGGLTQAEFNQLKGSPLYTYSSNAFQQVDVTTTTAVSATTIYYIENIDGAYPYMEDDGSFLIQGNYDSTSAVYTISTDSNNTPVPWIYNITDGNKDQFKHFQLTDTQVSRLNKNYNRELYPIPVFRERGLQSDWTLSDSSSFGYIYNKPPCLWANEDYYQSDNYIHMYTPLYSNTESYTATAYSGVTLTSDDYIPNKYYILENNNYILSTTAVFSAATTYYEKNVKCIVNDTEYYLTSEEYKNLQQESSGEYKIPVVVLESTPLPEAESGLIRHSIEYIYDNYDRDDLWNFPEENTT